jgi:NADH-quinone oxidoreductase subunit C
MKAEELIHKIRHVFRDEVASSVVFRGEATVVIDKKSLKALCTFLRTEPDIHMNYFVDVLGADYLPLKPRFEVVYHMYSITKKHRIRVKVKLDDGDSMPTVSDIWPAANWPERETYDMFGITFEGHPNLTRIYLADDWQGHPLRKDYPLKGFKDKYNPFGEEKTEEE